MQVFIFYIFTLQVGNKKLARPVTEVNFYILPLQVGYKKVGYKLLEEFGVDGCNSCVGVVLVDENGNLDFAGADHLDVDV